MFTVKNFDHLLGTPGFSEALLTNHFTLYQGYVKNVNLLSESLKKLFDEGKTATPEYAEQKRRYGWEFNGMRLHEYYFENMLKGGTPYNETGPLAKKITEQFGNYEHWEKDFKATGSLRGIGWTILGHDPVTDTLINVWINEHDVGLLAGMRILLVMDVFEHAFMLDYGLKRAEYIQAFFQSIDGGVVEKRFLV